jgi:hypothetical protein
LKSDYGIVDLTFLHGSFVRSRLQKIRTEHFRQAILVLFQVVQPLMQSLLIILLGSAIA